MNFQANEFYKEPWFGIVLTLIFFPAGIFVLYRFGPWQKKTKLILATCLSIACIAVWGIAGSMPQSSNPGVGKTWLTTDNPKAIKPVTADTKMQLTVTHDGQVQLHGSTNLPTGMKLNTTVSQDETVVGDDLTVNNGHFKSHALKVSGKPLKPGTYSVHLTQAAWSKQPTAVTKRLGETGQHLRGKEVTKHHIDVRRDVTYAP